MIANKPQLKVCALCDRIWPASELIRRACPMCIENLSESLAASARLLEQRLSDLCAARAQVREQKKRVRLLKSHLLKETK